MLKVIYYAVTDARADLIALQAASIARFCTPPSELVVVNNAIANSPVANAITSECRNAGVRCVLVPDCVKIRITPNDAHASALGWLWSEVILSERPDFAVLIDFDMFTTAPFDVESYMDGGFLVAGVPQSRPFSPLDLDPVVRYFWPGLLIFNIANMPEPEAVNLDRGLVNGVNVDVGGQLHHYLDMYLPATRSMICHARITHSEGAEKLPEQSRSSYKDEFRCDVLAGGCFLHYTGGTGWDFPSPQLTHEKTAWVKALVDKCISGEWSMPKW